MRILLLSRYSNLGASSRYRSYQYLSYLRSLGHQIIVEPLLSDLYLERLYSGKRPLILNVGASYIQRFAHLLRSRQYDIVWLEYEAFPWVPYWFESLIFNSKIPYILDIDDAIFHRYDQHASAIIRSLLGRKIDCVMRKASLVVAGNNYIAAHAREAGASRVEIIPTVIDLDKYPLGPLPENKFFTIGWIGTPKTSHYLQGIKDALKKVCENGTARVLTIGARKLDLDGVHYEMRPWSDEREVEDMLKFDVGIMPLIDSPWERGKCGHKLIQYMACSRPVVASPVGVNRKIVEHGINGFLAADSKEWERALKTLQGNRILREKMGEAGRKKVEAEYCLNITAPRLSSLLDEVLKDHR